MQRFFRNVFLSAIVAICGIALYQVGSHVHAQTPSISLLTGSYLTYTGTTYVPTLTFSSASSGDLGEVYLTSSANSGSLGTYSGKVTLDLSHVGGALWSPTITFPAFSTYTGTNLRLHGFVFDAAHTVTGYLMQTIAFVPNNIGPDWGVIYTAIGTSLSGQGIMNNFNLVTSGNASNFTGLYFAKLSGSTELGRITFGTGLDLTDTGTQNFLSGELPGAIGMQEGQIWFNPGTGFVGKNATLKMNIPDTYASILSSINTGSFAVRAGSGGAVTGNSMISNVYSGGACTAGNFGCSLYLDVGHFTQFDIKPILTAIHIVSNNGTNTAYAKSGDIVTLSFTGSEALSGVTVTINGVSATIAGAGTTRTATGIILAAYSGTTTFVINYSDLYNNTGTTRTTTTDSSSVIIDNITPTLTGAATVNVSNQNATFVFTGNEVGTVTYSGTCGNGSVTTNISGSNSTVFSPGNNTYTGCQLKVTDAAGNVSSWLTLPTFTINYTAPSGGGGGGGGGSSSTGNDEIATTVIAHTSGSIINSSFSVELNNAYLYAYDLGITTMNTIQKANMTGGLIRAHMAKMMVNYAIKVLNKYPNPSSGCVFNDIASQTTEMKNYIKRACELGLMGVGINSFDPNGEVNRAQFGTVLSRALYGTQYDGGTPYYLNHLNALKTNSIISVTTPTLKEIRGYVMLMLYRAQ